MAVPRLVLSLYNLSLKGGNAGLAFLVVLLLQRVGQVETVASLVLSTVLVSLASQLVAVPLGQDLLRSVASERSEGMKVALTIYYSKIALLRSLSVALAVGAGGLLSFIWPSTSYPNVGFVLFTLSATVPTTCLSTVVGHSYAAEKNTLGFVVGQGLLVNLLNLIYLTGCVSAFGILTFSLTTYLTVQVLTGALMTLGLFFSRCHSAFGRRRSPSHNIVATNTGLLTAVSIVALIAAQVPTLIVGALANPDLVVQFFLVQRFSSQLTLISSSITIQFVPDLVGAFRCNDFRMELSRVLFHYRATNLTFGIAAMLIYSGACFIIMYVVTKPSLWPSTWPMFGILFLSGGVAAICGISAPLLVAGSREFVLASSYLVAMLVIGITYLLRDYLSELEAVVLLAMAQVAAVIIQYIYIRVSIGVDILFCINKDRG